MSDRRTAIKAAAGLLGLLASPFADATGQGASLKFEIYKDTGGDFRWRLKAANGQTIATPGQGYKTKVACRNGIEAIKRGAATASIVEVP